MAYKNTSSSIRNLSTMAYYSIENLQSMISDSKGTGFMDLHTDLLAVSSTLKDIERVSDDEWAMLGEQVVTDTKETLSGCGGLCHRFQQEIIGWSQQSRRDSKAVAVRGSEKRRENAAPTSRMTALSPQLQGCRATLGLLVTVANLCKE
jgi:predicted Fe-S protein YdhL (DUF1289 family)